MSSCSSGRGPPRPSLASRRRRNAHSQDAHVLRSLGLSRTCPSTPICMRSPVSSGALTSLGAAADRLDPHPQRECRRKNATTAKRLASAPTMVAVVPSTRPRALPTTGHETALARRRPRTTPSPPVPAQSTVSARSTCPSRSRTTFGPWIVSEADGDRVRSTGTSRKATAIESNQRSTHPRQSRRSVPSMVVRCECWPTACRNLLCQTPASAVAGGNAPPSTVSRRPVRLVTKSWSISPRAATRSRSPSSTARHSVRAR